MRTEYNLGEARLTESFSFAAGESRLPYGADVGGVYECGPSYFTERDCFSHSILLYTLEGCGEYRYRGKHGFLPEGTMILLDARYGHRYQTAAGKRWKFIWMHYQDRGKYSLADYFFEMGVEVQQVPRQEAWRFYQELVRLSSGAAPLGELQAAQTFLRFLGDWGVYNFQSAYPVVREHGETVTRAQLYIQEHYAQKLDLGEIARACAVDKYHLIRLFGKYLGMTPHQYLLRVRIGQAKLLLLATDFPVSRIGEQVGFGNDSTFISAFKKLTGSTPLWFRNYRGT